MPPGEPYKVNNSCLPILCIVVCFLKHQTHLVFDIFLDELNMAKFFFFLFVVILKWVFERRAQVEKTSALSSVLLFSKAFASF